LCQGALYLDPDTTYAVVQKLAQQQGEPFTVTAPTLRKRLKERGKLAATDEKRQVLTVRKTLQGSRRDVLRLAPGAHPSLPDARPTRPEGEESQESWDMPGSGGAGDPTEPPDQGDAEPDHGPDSGSGGRSGAGTRFAAPDHGNNGFSRRRNGDGRVGQAAAGDGSAAEWQEGEL
jgi:hypothetical protein